jgi:hypothetical protein
VNETPNEVAARAFEAAGAELEKALEHCRTASKHYRANEVPRGAAHAWAAFGHIRLALDRFDEQARTHAARSRPV